MIVVASFFLVQVADAQLFNWGIKGGLGFSSTKPATLNVRVKGASVRNLTIQF